MTSPTPTVISASFITGARSKEYIPDANLPEIAVAGRSNVGKSSLLRILLDNRKLVRVSQTPGRTREVNFFRVDTRELGSFVLADLPGYGYAKVPVSLKKEWGAFITRYLEERQELITVVLLLDARREVRNEEKEFVMWLDQLGIPTLLVVTKIDKVSKTERGAALQRIKREMNLASLPLIFSAQTKEGLEAIWRKLSVALASVEESHVEP
ncbi:ribosome biogenesis GTP-binding protein YihA/YsxC [Myxococcota bacterium]|nr:ribosome biogenesis GTP-binding protein YihA/YsxC [Myxococcota bacterium]MBU1537247.1 ribosome biogenesis GTP-binding protein YihA/YsxC [Myxococcota bacterium]